MKNPYQTASFLTSVAKIAQLPEDDGIEVAFAGRSNSGKSSAINCITHQKSLARTSKTPGRTQLINFFGLGDSRFLVDLPGYGYAKVPEKLRAEWQGLLTSYLEGRKSLRGVVVLMDSRHPLKDSDRQLVEWCDHFSIPVHVLLSKADKLSRNEANKSLFFIRKELAYINNLSAQLFSSTKRTGLEECILHLNKWYQQEEDCE